MANPVKRGDFFAPELVADLINKVRGRSTIAKLAQQTPIAFNGNEIFTFNFDNDIDIVAESGKKTPGGVTFAKTRMVPLKVEYSARFSDEFVYAAEEVKLEYLKAFNEGYARKLARGIDLMVMHGVNPRGGAASEVIGTNHLDSLVEQTVTYDAANIDANLESAIFMVTGSQGVVNGLALSPTAGQALAQVKINGVRQYPEFRFGANPGNFSGMSSDVNETVSAHGTTQAYVGDFANMLKWGYAKQIPLQVIEYGDPDNTGRDLQGYNEVLLRSETYIGWGILDPSAFARVTEATEESEEPGA